MNLKKKKKRQNNMKKLFFLFSVFTLFQINSTLLCGDEAETESRLDSIVKELEEIETELKESRAKYLNPLTLNKDYKESDSNKMKKANFYFDKEDYISSGSIYYSVMTSRKAKDSLWEEAVYKLGESLFRNRNYISSVRYFEMLITDIEESKYKIESLKRLISANYHLGNYAVAKKYYTEFVEIGYDMLGDQDLIYFLAKSLFFDNQADEAAVVFSSIDEKCSYYPQSRYFLGVINLKHEKLEEALGYFEKVVETADKKEFYKFDRVFELSVIAAARVAFELEDFDKSIKYYVMLDKKSEHFAEAYYELCWTYIKKAEYQRAVEALRLIKYIAPDSIIAPRAEILEGELLVKMKKYGEAMVIFDQIVKKYSAVKSEINTIDSESFLTSAKSGKMSQTLFSYSPVIRSLFKDNKKFSSAMSLSDSLLELQKEVDRASRLEHKIASIIDNKNIASLYPPLKEGSNQVMSLQNKVASIRNELLDLRKAAVWDFVADSDKENFNKLEEEKSDLVGIVTDAQISPEQIEKQSAEYAGAIINMEGELHRITIQTNSLLNQLDSIGLSYAKSKSADQLDSRLLDKINREKKEIQKTIDALSKHKEEVENEKNYLVLRGDKVSRVIIARNRLNAIILNQDEILSKYDAKSKNISSRTKELLKELQKTDSGLAKFYIDLNDAVKEVVNEIKVSYENERNNLGEYKSELLEIKREVSEMAALAMYSNINKIKSSFTDLILQADLGIIDVAWEKKADATLKTQKLKVQKFKEIRELNLNLEGDK